MSDNGIYVSLSGALAQNQRLETIANNIANVNTPAFKRDQQVFREYLTATEKEPDVIQAPRIPASIESFYDNNGGEKAFVDSKGTFTDQSQGSLKQTQNPLDLAVEGKGFLEVLTPQGIRFTRNGALKVDNQGRLVSKEGYPILKAGAGDDGAARTIQVQGANLTISPKGEIFEGANSVGQLSLVEFNKPDALLKIGNSMYRINDGMEVEKSESRESQIHQGFLELSNINIVKEMTDMISATRLFEANQQAMKAADQMNGKLVNDVPKMG